MSTNQMHHFVKCNFPCRPDLENVLRRLENQLDAGPSPLSNYINVMRDTVLPSALRAFSRQNVSPDKRLNVVFVDMENNGEGAVDDGEPTREFFRLLISEVKNSQYFCGADESKNLTLVSRGKKHFSLTKLKKFFIMCFENL